MSRAKHVCHQDFFDGMRQDFFKDLTFMNQMRENEMTDDTGTSFKCDRRICGKVEGDAGALFCDAQDYISKLFKPRVVKSKC